MTDGTIDKPWLRVAAYALCVNDHQILLARLNTGQSDSGKWTLPGGGLNWGEAPEDGSCASSPRRRV